MRYPLGLSIHPMPPPLRAALIVSAAVGAAGGLLVELGPRISADTGRGLLGVSNGLGLLGVTNVVVAFTVAAGASLVTRKAPAPRWSTTGRALLVAAAVAAVGVGLASQGFIGLALATFVAATCLFTVSFYAMAPAPSGIGGELR